MVYKIDVFGDWDDLYLEMQGSPKKINIEPVKHVPEKIAIVGGCTGFGMLACAEESSEEIEQDIQEIGERIEEIDVNENKVHLSLSAREARTVAYVLARESERKILYHLNLLSEVEEVTIRTMGKVGKLVLRVCKSVSEVVIRLFGKVKRLILGGFDVFKTKINVRHYTKKRTKKAIIRLLKIVAAAVSTFSVALKLYELLGSPGLLRLASSYR